MHLEASAGWIAWEGNTFLALGMIFYIQLCNWRTETVVCIGFWQKNWMPYSWRPQHFVQQHPLHNQLQKLQRSLQHRASLPEQFVRFAGITGSDLPSPSRQQQRIFHLPWLNGKRFATLSKLLNKHSVVKVQYGHHQSVELEDKG